MMLEAAAQHDRTWSSSLTLRPTDPLKVQHRSPVAALPSDRRAIETFSHGGVEGWNAQEVRRRSRRGDLQGWNS